MFLLEFLSTNPAGLTAVAAVLGLAVGSFLNVVIYRLPKMMEREWRAQCLDILGANRAATEPAALATGATRAESKQTETGPAGRFNLATPRSHCPECGHTVSALENIPLLSYLVLKGRCGGCGARIPLRYPIVELLTGVLSAVVVFQFGFTWQAAAALLLTWALIALSFIDFDQQLLPDSITLPFLWIGLTLSLFGVFTDPRASIIGGLVGYLVLWSVYKLFKLVTGKEGMGYGDFKLLSLLGAWMGWQALPVVVIMSSVVGTVVGIAQVALLRRDRSVPIPFGPYLAAAGWITLLWGQDITEAYFRWSGL